jgi:hypothetical protein
MNAVTRSFLIGRSRREEALTLFLLLATALLLVSCAGPQNNKPIAQNEQERPAQEEKVSSDKNTPIVYGKPGPGMIRVYISGPDCTSPGIYYFKTGTTLQEALAATRYTDFARRFCIYNRAESSPIRSRYKLRHLSDAEKAKILHDNDCLDFICTLI